MVKNRVQNPGFTLLEILVVISLIVLLAGASGGVYFGSLKRRQLERCGGQLLMMAQYARLVAVERQTPCALHLDQAKNRFFLSIDEYDKSGQAGSRVLTNPYTQPETLSGELKFEKIVIQPRPNAAAAEENPQEQTILFLPDGTADAALVQLGDERWHLTLTVSAATGKARLSPGVIQDVPPDHYDLDLESGGAELLQ